MSIINNLPTKILENIHSSISSDFLIKRKKIEELTRSDSNPMAKQEVLIKKNIFIFFYYISKQA